ncbi:hypothetical protein NMG60_11022954 [Bertholletia excelsa]
MDVPATKLAAALERAAMMAKQLPAATDPTQIIQIYAALHSAHNRLSFFLAETAQTPDLTWAQPVLPLPHPGAAGDADTPTNVAAGRSKRGISPPPSVRQSSRCRRTS